MNKEEIREKLKKALDALHISYDEDITDIRIIVHSSLIMMMINLCVYPIDVIDITYFSTSPTGTWKRFDSDVFTDFHHLLSHILRVYYGTVNEIKLDK